MVVALVGAIFEPLSCLAHCVDIDPLGAGKDERVGEALANQKRRLDQVQWNVLAQRFAECAAVGAREKIGSLLTLVAIETSASGPERQRFAVACAITRAVGRT